MIDLKILRDKGITEESLKQKLAIDQFTREFTSDPDGKLKRLINRIRARIQEGMDRNFRDFKVAYALDLAWETPFRQITPTIIQSFISQDPNQAEVASAMESWGLTSLISEETDAKSGKKVKRFNYPVFFNIVVPLVRAYVTIRWAKIMNDRLITPFFKIEPIKNTTTLSLKQLLAQDRFKVSAHCTRTIEMLKNLKKGLTKLTYVVPDEHKHIFDALTYALMMECAEELEVNPVVLGRREMPLIVQV